MLAWCAGILVGFFLYGSHLMRSERYTGNADDENSCRKFWWLRISRVASAPLTTLAPGELQERRSIPGTSRSRALERVN